jgi:hypothetical protein
LCKDALVANQRTPMYSSFPNPRISSSFQPPKLTQNYVIEEH